MPGRPSPTHCLLFWGTLISVLTANHGFLSPFFYVCNYHNHADQSSLDAGEIQLSITLEGNPQFYVPERMYQVQISSSMTFNGFLLTGLYTMPSPQAGAGKTSIGNIPNQWMGSRMPLGQSFLCSVVQNYHSRQPRQQLSFIWKAPPKDTGCVSFLATATLGSNILFKDTTVLQICEEGSTHLTPTRPPLTVVHEDGLILREDFDTSDSLNTNIWTSNSGGKVSNECGTILHGDAFVFCGSKGHRQLVSTSLNLTTAAIIQFAIGTGSCRPSFEDKNIVVSYAHGDCNSWSAIDTFKAPIGTDTVTHLLHLPHYVRRENVCLKWHQNSALTGYVGCWALDNILLVNTADTPTSITDNFDPIESSNWLFFPGAVIKHKCQSEENALIFNNENHNYNYVTTRDLNLLKIPDNALLDQHFDDQPNASLSEWSIVGGAVSSSCGVLDEGNAAYFYKAASTRMLCSPFLDLSSAANLRFYFSIGSQLCQAGNSSNTRSRVLVFTEDRQGNTQVVHKLSFRGQQKPKFVSVIIPTRSRKNHSRVCWLQKRPGGENENLWAVDSVQITPHLPSTIDDVIQFSLNVRCGGEAGNNDIDLDVSTDHGQHWFPLHQPCLSPGCHGDHQPLSSRFNIKTVDGWSRVTLPLPYAALTPHVRFRWKQKHRSGPSHWAIDNVFIGRCPTGCSGHGVCTENSCRCDFGYHGQTCNQSSSVLPTYLIDTMNNVGGVTANANFKKILGASVSYDCGVLDSGKAVVFHKDGCRQLLTVDLNTTNAKYLQFSIRIGSDSPMGSCPAPDHPTEAVFLHFSCTGGLTWDLLKELHPEHYKQPKVVLVHLPVESQCLGCQFQWWQPEHSGDKRDVWAIDDVSISDALHDSINVNFTDTDTNIESWIIHRGRQEFYCAVKNTLSFTQEYVDGDSRYLTTSSMHIGPFYMIQFDLVMGCGVTYSGSVNNKIYLEFSTDHGMAWSLLRKPCIAPSMCREYTLGTQYDASEYSAWKRVTVALPQNTWSQSTRFRWIQRAWRESDDWAITNIYIGQQCPEMCRGHGSCYKGQCICDSGFGGATCEPEQTLPSRLHSHFTLMTKLKSDWSAILGGEVVSSNQGCHMIFSGESLYFSKEGLRQLISHDMNATQIDFVQFYIKLGGSNSLGCQGVDERAENVLVQYSRDAGTTWRLLKELSGADYRKARFVHLRLPEEAKTTSTRIRWWQPSHSGRFTDQWAIDEVQFGKYEALEEMLDDFEQQPTRESDGSSIWLTLTEGMYARYCLSDDDTLMFANQMNDKIAMTKDLKLTTDDVIQFKINVGCSQTFSASHPVKLQFSTDSGQTWSLVQHKCYPRDSCNEVYHEDSVYPTGTYGDWTTVIIPVPDQMTKGKINVRWWQAGSAYSAFALDDVYIGPACTHLCRGHGICIHGRCQCDYGYTGTNCTSILEPPVSLIERFDMSNKMSALWSAVRGGQLGLGCGVIHRHNSVYFSSSGTRELRTKPLNTRNIKMAQFTIRIGNQDNRPGCRKPRDRNEAVIFDYSTNNGISWRTLKVLDPLYLSQKPRTVSVHLPIDAKTTETVFRWWQPVGQSDTDRAEWAIDNIIIAVQDSSMLGFQEDFDPMQSAIWYMAQNAVPKVACKSADNALEFSKNAGGMRYAETWDYQVTSSTFLQFDLAMGCSGTFSTLYHVMLEFSVNMGESWRPVLSACLPPARDCAGYHDSSSYLSQSHANWTRVSLYLPRAAVSDATRFRWVQNGATQRGNVWALDNVYLGEGCPWMCSGHGYCNQGSCRCDKGFIGEFCVPGSPLPDVQKDDFNKGWSRQKWPELYGGKVTTLCGVLIADKSLTFYKKPLRLVVTQDLDCSVAMFVQFHFSYGCRHQGALQEWPRKHSILLHYSNNGGITWHLMKEIHFTRGTPTRFFSVAIPTLAQTNATRFRFWQPQHDGVMQNVWSLDNVHIGGGMVNPDTLYETFDITPYAPDWTFWPGGAVDKYCPFSIRADDILSGSSAMVFKDSAGEHSITTRDLNVNEMTVIQFDINVGCTQQSSLRAPVSLQYSLDNGRSWHLVIPRCSHTSMPSCAERQYDATLFYSGMSKIWQRVIVPLSATRITGTARFRWYQGFFSQDETVPHWALDNVYIGMQCRDHCGGHGTCINGMLCQCDDHYRGNECQQVHRNPTFLKDGFEGDLLTSVDNTKWLQHSGGSRTTKCGVVLSGHAFHFHSNGFRALVTRDLDLSISRVIQFYLKFGCDGNLVNEASEPVLLQYSTSGGISWTTIDQFYFSRQKMEPFYVALNVPKEARTKATRVRWMQNSLNGSYSAAWAIDQIFIGGNIQGQVVLQDGYDQRHNANWVMTPGATLEAACRSTKKVLHFKDLGSVRYAETTDMLVTAHTYLQYEIVLRCSATHLCYDVELQFSVDLGKSWIMVEKDCLPSDVDCEDYHGSSTLSSAIYIGWHRVTIKLPYYTRSKATRFRWIQQKPYRSHDKWALGHVYIGDECLHACSGHGRCNQGTCNCDDNWSGVSCDRPVNSLPSTLKDVFSEIVDAIKWLSSSGATVSMDCDVLSAGRALYFGGGCVRQLVTTDLDLRAAMFVQFYVKLGCYSAPDHRDEGVIIDYSRDGGISWSKMVELYYDQYRNTSYVTLELPKNAKTIGVRIRWWQPHHPGISRSDWALDNIVIGGKEINPDAIKDNFDSALRDEFWLEKDNILIGPYCGQSSSVIGVSKPNDKKITLTTVDMNIERNYILQFSISVGCNTSSIVSGAVSPIQLRFSTDFGMSWRDLSDGCVPSMPGCQGVATTPSAYYANSGWRRVTMVLASKAVSRATRFQWVQSYKNSADQQHWGLDDVYIGPACKDMCHGHGRCDFPQCICDHGYGGNNCHLMDQKPQADSAVIVRTGGRRVPSVKTQSQIKTYLKDSFEDSEIDSALWALVQGAVIGHGCSVPTQSKGLHFMGEGQRLAMTVDLDLRDARFVQYKAEIGGRSSKVECGRAKSAMDSVIVQFSTNAGITWTTLHVLDHMSYTMPRHDYITLPVDARTNSTRLLWWQLTSHKSPQTAWTIDNVHIGGTEINPSELYATFDQPLDERLWEFHPGAETSQFLCGSPGKSLLWQQKNNKESRSITTGQLIVQENYMMQFKISVGCRSSRDDCTTDQAVQLEHNTEPSSDKWHLVQKPCMQPASSSNMDCGLHNHHQGSIYTANSHGAWTRVTIPLLHKVYSSMTRFRFIQTGTARDAPEWALDSVYIGEQCPDMCNGRGDCVHGQCRCDLGYQGLSCKPRRGRMMSHLMDGFEAGVSSMKWAVVQGGNIGMGCGVLRPYSHGKSLYFNGCGQRQLISAELDTIRASKIMFVLQIGSIEQKSSCNVDLTSDDGFGSVLLQYTKDKGIHWHLITVLKPQEFLRPKKMSYSVPYEARDTGIQFRWWQPKHHGTGHDQWAVDAIEIVMTYQDQQLRSVQNHGRGWRRLTRSP